jgi:3-methyladenine DNA glycosylase AlkD
MTCAVAPLEAKQVLQQLEKMGKPQARKIYLRHGYAEPLFGVTFADLNALQKKIKTDQALADALWKSGIADARILAAMVADPNALTLASAEKWVAETDFRTLRDYVGALVARSPHALELAAKWALSADSAERQVGCVVIAKLAQNGRPVPLALSREILERIELEIHVADNWSRYGMMYALIGIGAYNPALTKDVIAAAKRIGKVEFDPGETACKMPDPVPYIKRTLAHQAPRKKAK